MQPDERAQLFEQSLLDFRAGRVRLASSGLERLVKDGSRDPAHLSYYGLIRAASCHDPSGIRYCEQAVQKDGRRASVLYLNLARALAAVGRRGDAVHVVSRGLAIHSKDEVLRRELQHLVPRARPAFPRLGRKHALNRFAGKARTWGGRLWLVVTRPNREPRDTPA